LGEGVLLKVLTVRNDSRFFFFFSKNKIGKEVDKKRESFQLIFLPSLLLPLFTFFSTFKVSDNCQKSRANTPTRVEL
jgi:hypothetical protein